MAFASVSEWSTTAASNTTLNTIPLDGATTTASQVDDIFREMMAQIGAYTRAGADLATAATLNLDSVDTLLFDLTGTTTVTAVTLTEGHWRICRATGAFGLTASASLIVNGSAATADTTVAGDLLYFRGYAAGVVRVWRFATGSGGSGTAATASEFWLATDATKFIPPSLLTSAAALVTLTDGASIAADMSTFVNATVTLGGNRTLANPTNAVVGRSGVIYVVQDATGSRTLAYGTSYKFASGTAPTLSTAANTVDRLTYFVRTSTHIDIDISKARA